MAKKTRLHLIETGPSPIIHDAGGGEPPMEILERLIKIEAMLPTLATKEEMHKEFAVQTWRVVTFVTTICTALTAAVYFIAKNVH